MKMTILKKPGACARSWHPVLGGRQNVHLDIGFWGFAARAFFQNTICPKARHFFFRNQVFFITQFLTFFCKLSQLGWAPAGEFFGTFQAMADRGVLAMGSFRRWPTAEL